MLRNNFYQVPDVPVADLLLDTFNPRIRHGQDQNDCIHRLLRDRANFINLCKDIAARGLTPEHILVSKNAEGKWVVRDGNRRVAALKLLNTPSQVHADTALFNTLTRAAGMPGANIPGQINCLACDDEKTILDYLERKHTGENQGVGQRNWSALLKSLFNIQTKARDDYKRAAQLLLWVADRGLNVEDDFYISTLQRGLNADTLDLIGFAVRDDDLVPVLPELQAYALAARVIQAVASEEVNVKREGEPGSIFTPEAQMAFFTTVRRELGPPLATQIQEQAENEPPAQSEQAENDPPAQLEQAAASLLAAPSMTQGTVGTRSPAVGGQTNYTPTPTPIPTRLPSSPNTAPQDRKFLFGKTKTASPGLSIPSSETKVQSIIVELRKLNPHDTPLATTMLLRALLELSNEYYRGQHSLSAISHLHQSVANSADHMLNAGLLVQPEHDLVMSYTRSATSMLHIKTIQAYIHRTTHHPNGQALNTIWDEIGCFLRACWK